MTITEGIQYRDIAIRATDTDKREITGIAVPYNDPISFCGIREEFAPGAVAESDGMLFWRHEEPIGALSSQRDTKAGWEITGRVSHTQLGEDALTLVRDGVVTKLSVGFLPLEHIESKTDDGTVLIRHTKVHVREVSLVPHPAYNNATITSTREAPTTNEGAPAMPTTIDLDSITATLADHTRALSLLEQHTTQPPAADTRTAATVLRALASGDQATITEINELYARDYTGSTTADAIVKDTWVGDLSQIVADANPLMSLFASGVLPPRGNNIEYGQLKTNTVKSEKQTEGEDLAYGKLTFKTATAPVHTYGGYVRLTIQEIERSSNAVLDMNLRAQALGAGVALARAFATHFTAAVTAQDANKVVVSDFADWTKWFSGILAASKKLRPLGLPLAGLIADEKSFTEIGTMKDSAGRPIMDVNSDGTNTVGTITAPLEGRLLRVRVICNQDGPENEVAFYNPAAIRSYTNPLARLQDVNVINLSKDFSVYQYAALADEIPGAIIPVKKA